MQDGARRVSRANKRPALPAIMLAVGLLVCLFSLEASSSGFLVSPVEVNLGSVNGYSEPVRELRGGVTAFLSSASTLTNSMVNVVVAVSRGLTETVTGRTLPVDRLMIGEDALAPLAAGSATFTAYSGGVLKLRIGVRLEPFDVPGSYEGTLIFLESTGKTTEVRVRVEVLKWASLRAAVSRNVLTSTGTEEPGAGAYLTSGFANALQVASNCRWKLVAQVDADLSLRSGLERRIPRNELAIKVQRTEWFTPLTEGFVRFDRGELLLGEGKPTGALGGWVPVTLDLRLPYDRHKMAGPYGGNLGFTVSPL